MPRCTVCGELSPGRFCGNCGSRLPEEEEPTINTRDMMYTDEQKPKVQVEIITNTTPSQIFDNDMLSAEERRVSKAVDNASNKANWNRPASEPRKNYKPEMTPEEEMNMLRARRRQVEEQMRREGKLK